MKSWSLVAVCALVLSACGSSSSDSDKPQVVAAFYPYAFVAEQVGGDLVDVENLTSPGVDAHDLELRPKQVAAVQEADLVIYQHEFQAPVDDAVDNADRDSATTLDTAELAPDVAAQEPQHAEESDGHDHEGEEHADEHEGHDHEHEGLDPHMWLDLGFMQEVTQQTADRLADADPDHAEQFQANADALIGELSNLEGEFATGLQTCKTRTIVTSHAAFGYLAAKYDLTQVAIAGIDPSNEPSGRQLADIADEVDELGITTIFTEELVDPANAETIASATGASTAVLDPIEGLGSDTSDETYLTLMKRNLDAIQKANSCS